MARAIAILLTVPFAIGWGSSAFATSLEDKWTALLCRLDGFKLVAQPNLGWDELPKDRTLVGTEAKVSWKTSGGSARAVEGTVVSASPAELDILDANRRIVKVNSNGVSHLEVRAKGQGKWRRLPYQLADWPKAVADLPEPDAAHVIMRFRTNGWGQVEPRYREAKGEESTRVIAGKLDLSALVSRGVVGIEDERGVLHQFTQRELKAAGGWSGAVFLGRKPPPGRDVLYFPRESPERGHVRIVEEMDPRKTSGASERIMREFEERRQGVADSFARVGAEVRRLAQYLAGLYLGRDWDAIERVLRLELVDVEANELERELARAGSAPHNLSKLDQAARAFLDRHRERFAGVDWRLARETQRRMIGSEETPLRIEAVAASQLPEGDREKLMAIVRDATLAERRDLAFSLESALSRAGFSRDTVQSVSRIWTAGAIRAAERFPLVEDIPGSTQEIAKQIAWQVERSNGARMEESRLGAFALALAQEPDRNLVRRFLGSLQDRESVNWNQHSPLLKLFNQISLRILAGEGTPHVEPLLREYLDQLPRGRR